VLKLGTARHHQGLLRGIDNVDDVGCFALTELGFGAWHAYGLHPGQVCM
jgi:acyl-CoA oxidase